MKQLVYWHNSNSRIQSLFFWIQILYFEIENFAKKDVNKQRKSSKDIHHVFEFYNSKSQKHATNRIWT